MSNKNEIEMFVFCRKVSAAEMVELKAELELGAGSLETGAGRLETGDGSRGRHRKRCGESGRFKARAESLETGIKPPNPPLEKGGYDVVEEES